MLTSLCSRIALLNADEIRCSNGLVLTSMDQDVVKATNVSVSTPTNCVNCGAVIDPNVDHCEYCGTSYALMGVKASPTEQVVHLKLENKLLASKIDITQRYNDAIRAMGSYARHY